MLTRKQWLAVEPNRLLAVGGNAFDRSRMAFLAAIVSNKWPNGGPVAHAWRWDGELYAPVCGLGSLRLPFTMLRAHSFSVECRKCFNRLWAGYKVSANGD